MGDGNESWIRTNRKTEEISLGGRCQRGETKKKKKKKEKKNSRAAGHGLDLGWTFRSVARLEALNTFSPPLSLSLSLGCIRIAVIFCLWCLQCVFLLAISFFFFFFFCTFLLFCFSLVNNALQRLLSFPFLFFWWYYFTHLVVSPLRTCLSVDFCRSC